MPYNSFKELTESAVLEAIAEVYGLNIPAGQWHSLEVLEHGTVIFEAKDGPYTPLGGEYVME